MAERTARAVLLNEPGEPAVVEEVVLDPPGPGEVQVRIAASGVCHTDLHFKLREGRGLEFPILLGHEGAGSIEEVGDGVESLQEGDPVAVAWTVPCDVCDACLRGEPRRCWTWRPQIDRMRRARDGKLLSRVLGVGSFCERVVVPADAVIRMPAELPAEQACLIACCVCTGTGAVFNTTPIRVGSLVAVVGCGAVGLSAIQAARISGAERIFAVDLVDRKLEWARQAGATDLVNAGDADPVKAVKAATDGRGVDFSYEAVGLPVTFDQALRMLAREATVTLIGVPPLDALVDLNIGFLFGKRNDIRVCEGGDTLATEDFPKLAKHALDGELDLGMMVTRRIALDDVEDAFRAMEAGEVIRSVIVFD
jgi:S-(hydroxymethyl)mycothiol dehydrogenase